MACRMLAAGVNAELTVTDEGANYVILDAQGFFIGNPEVRQMREIGESWGFRVEVENDAADEVDQDPTEAE